MPPRAVGTLGSRFECLFLKCPLIFGPHIGHLIGHQSRRGPIGEARVPGAGVEGSGGARFVPDLCRGPVGGNESALAFH